MRSGPNTRRPMRRGGGGGNNNSGGRRGGSPRSQNFESNGPDLKVRGNAQQIVDKYQTLAREAATAGNPVMAENYYQHAEHYHRVLTANGGGENRQNNRQPDSEENRNNNNNGADNNQQVPNGQSVAANGDGAPNRPNTASEAAKSSDPRATPDAVPMPETIVAPVPENPGKDNASPESVASTDVANGSPSIDAAEKPSRRRAPRTPRPAKAAEPIEAAPSETVDASPAPAVAQPATEGSDEEIKTVT